MRFSQEDSCDPSCSILPRNEGDRELVCQVHKEERCQDVKKKLEKSQNRSSYSSFSMLNIPDSVSPIISDVTSSSSSSSGNNLQSTDPSARPQIAGLTIHDEQRSCPNDYHNTNNFVLNFTLLLPSGEHLHRTSGLLLKIEHDAQEHRDSSKCRVFDFRNVKFPPEAKYEKKYIQYNFFTYFQKFKTHVFQVKLIALPGGVNSTYIVTAYVNPLKVNKKRTIAVSVGTESSSLHVVFEPSRQYVADSYNVSLIQFSHLRDPYSSRIVQQQQLAGNQTEAEFTDVQPGYYQIQVNVISSDCEVQTMNSTSFTMGSPLKNGRSTSSKTLTTTTAVLKHRISSTSGIVKTTTSETRTISHQQDDVKIQPSDQSGEYERSLKIMLGTVFGVVGSVTIIIVVFCMYRKRNYTSGSHIEHPQLSDAMIEDFDMKQHFPNVLLLYSSDCTAHECAVQAVAAFLMQICNCNVHIDLFEEHVIQEKGLNDWLLDNLQEAEYIMVLCSVGSRLRCKKNMQFRQDPHRTIPDYFALAVDYVAEKMRIERCKGMSLSKFIVLYLDYSVEGDIPAQLDLAQKFQMMRDISSLVCHLHGLSSERSKFSTYPGITAKNYDKSDVGLRLKVAIEQAKQYFKDNPSWVEDHLEPVPRPVGSKFKPKHTRHSSGEPLLLPEHNIEKTSNQKHVNRHASFSHYLGSQRDIFGMYNQESRVPVTNLVHSRLNSLPSSLNSHATLTPFPLSTHTSHSYENISQGKKMQELDMFCAEPNMSLTLYPPIQQHNHKPHLQQQQQQQSPQSEAEEGFDVQRGKSRSLPVVSRANKSLTVLEAEVHKEWDPETKLLSGSPPPEADSSSNEGELELDLLSIKIPPNFRHVFYTPNQNCVELQPCFCSNSSGVGTGVVYRPAHRKGLSVLGMGTTNMGVGGGGITIGHRGSEDNRSLCRPFPTLEPLPRCVSLDDGSTTSYESVMDQIMNSGPNILDGPFVG